MSAFLSMVEFPDEWPSNQEQILFELSEVANIKMTSLPNGKLKFNLNDNGDKREFTTQEIQFTRSKAFLLAVVWRETTFNIYIGGGSPMRDSSSDEIKIVDNPPKSNIPLPELDSQSVRDVCQNWIDWRITWNSNRPQPRQGRRRKTIEELTTNLDVAIKDLSSLYSRSENRNYNDLQGIFPILRALLCWTDNNNRNYNPLLFSMAGKIDLALPVYAFENTIESPIAGINSYFNFYNNSASLIKSYPGQEVVDFQEWLTYNIFEKNSSISFTYKDLIFQGTNTNSNGHFDEDIPENLDILTRNLIQNNPLIIGLVADITRIAIHYGSLIVEKLRNP